MRGDVGAPGLDSGPAAGVAAGRRPFAGRRIVLGVTGGIAAYKVVQLARDLALLGAAVDVVMTRAAQSFVGPITFEALTGRPVHTEILAQGNALDHIRLAKAADLVCVAPATADFIARAAAGRADDLLAATVLATRAPVVVCPAMNDGMWAHAQTQANVGRLREFGYTIVGPATGALALGEGSGPGRLEEPATILAHLGRALGGDAAWAGRRVVVTAGPTREPVDAVRVISNRSSGRMGFAIAAAAWQRGADVLLIAGPTSAPLPVGPEIRHVESVNEMRDAVAAALPHADALFMAAAPADFTPAEQAAGKIKKGSAPAAIALALAPDILKTTRDARREGAVIVGFALETGDGRDYARAKLAEKGLDLVVLNSADEKGAGFDVATNRVTVFDREGREDSLPLMSKDDVADELLDRAAALLPVRR
jgi:phosphopantothenoylcysteine decarboxylase/phosphopantothenate--cysteine ligase